MATQAHAADEIRFYDLLPILVGDCFEGLGPIHAEIVDQSVDVGKTTDDALHGVGCAQIPGAGVKLGVPNKRPSCRRGIQAIRAFRP